MNKRGSVLSFSLSTVVLLVIIAIWGGYLLPTHDLDAFILPLFILLVTVIIARVSKQILHAYFEKASKRLRVFDRTKYALFGKLVSVIIWVVGIGFIVGTIPQLRAMSVSLFAGAGVLAVVIGFATQKTFGNIASGVFIATFQPYRIGDRLHILDEFGTVTDINLRHTVIETWDNRRIIIPNSKMDEEVIDNYTIGDPAILGTLDIGVSYDSDIDKARKIMREAVTLHPDYFEYDKHKEMLAGGENVRVRATKLTDSAVNLRLFYWAYDQPTNLKMRADLLESIKKQFDKQGIEIPFPYRTLVYKKDLPSKKQKTKKK